VYIDDAVAATILGIEKEEVNRVDNAGTGTAVDVFDCIKLNKSISNRSTNHS
jgi:nucleoside-diphosphate-sugar epimerase